MGFGLSLVPDPLMKSLLGFLGLGHPSRCILLDGPSTSDEADSSNEVELLGSWAPIWIGRRDERRGRPGRSAGRCQEGKKDSRFRRQDSGSSVGTSGSGSGRKKRDREIRPEIKRFR